jgi:large subunit ribosomal protein L1
MAKRGKKYRKVAEKVVRDKKYNVDEAIATLKQTKITKYDETINVSIRLGVDPKKSDQMVRGAITLPHGVGKTVKVLVIAKGDKEKEAKDAGADFVGSEDMIEKIQKGWLEFDKMVATPDVMGLVGRLGKILGPRGLMPNPKVGTVSFDVAKMVKEIKSGRIEFKVEKAGIVQAPIGKISFDENKIKDNFLALMEAIQKAKPSSSKGTYMKSVTISSCAGPGIKINPIEIEAALR